MTDTNINKKEVEERHIQAKGGMGVLFLLLFLMAVSIAAVVFGIIFLAEESFVLGGITIQLRSGNSGFAGGRSGDDIRQKNFVKSHDLEQ